MRGELPIEEIIYELSYMYKYEKEKWMAKRGDAIKRDNAKHNRANPSDEEIKNTSRGDYAAYVYLVLKVRLEHPFFYNLINVHNIKLLINLI